jgi:hypothetical protein
VVLVEAQACIIYPRENRDLLTELVELREHHTEVNVDHVVEVEELAALVTSISRVLVDLGLAPIRGIP